MITTLNKIHNIYLTGEKKKTRFGTCTCSRCLSFTWTQVTFGFYCFCHTHVLSNAGLGNISVAYGWQE